MSKMNLLAETTDMLTSRGKTPSDVLWVGVLKPSWRKPHSDNDPLPVGDWDDFAKLADFEYDAGYGGNEIEGNLVVVGDGWWLERGEYDGSEWWEFKTLPQKPASATPLRREDLCER